MRNGRCVSDLVTVLEHDIEPGDVVKVSLGGGLYYHYCVYYQNGHVFHCSGEVLDSTGGFRGRPVESVAQVVPLHALT